MIDKIKAIFKLLSILNLKRDGTLVLKSKKEGYEIEMGEKGIKILTEKEIRMNGRYILQNCKEDFTPSQFLPVSEVIEQILKENKSEEKKSI